MYKIEKTRRLWRRWEYELILSSYGMVWGRTWTKKQAKRQLMRAQSQWFSDK